MRPTARLLHSADGPLGDGESPVVSTGIASIPSGVSTVIDALSAVAAVLSNEGGKASIPSAVSTVTEASPLALENIPFGRFAAAGGSLGGPSLGDPRDGGARASS